MADIKAKKVIFKNRDGEYLLPMTEDKTGLVLFDTILKDHVLTFEESKGLALQGTYVYKNAVAGSRYGYPNFYNKCLEEYNEATEEMPWEQPINPSGISSTSGFSNASNAFDGDSSTYASCGTSTDYIEWDLGKTITISGFNASNQQIASTSRACNVAIYSVDSSGNETLLANGTGAPVKGDGTSSATFTPTKVNKLRFKLIPADDGDAITTQYPSRILQINIIATNPKLKKNSNGHIFYDISIKNEIDEIFASTGMAWYYGIDTENERIFLPRNNWFEQATSDISEVGLGVEAGLPNIEGRIAIHALVDKYSGALYELTTTHTRLGGEQGYTPLDTGFNASKSNPIYGNSDTVQPNAVKKLLYICVGNTESQSVVTDVVDVTTTENDTLPLGYYFYQKNAQPSISYLKSQGQWNDGKRGYTTFYNEFVNKIGQDFASGKVVEYTEEYTDYDLVINQTDMTFRLPLLDGSESLVSDRYEDLTLEASGSTYTAPANGWFYIDKASTANGQYLVFANSTSNFATNWQGTGGGCMYICPVRKEDQIKVIYTLAGSTNAFRFVYAQGNGSLYFKVANAVQNLELLDAGEVMEAVNNVVPNNSSLIASYGMPSNRYIDLTLGASGTTYTAPANGWISFTKTSNANNQYISLKYTNDNFGSIIFSTATGNTLRTFLPVTKSQIFTVSYNAGGSTLAFRFIYAEGEQ